MKVLFVGPSLPDAISMVAPNIVIRPPATQGDVLAAIDAGATVIGLVDGGFEYTAPVWHKEILYGLSRGVSILGAASMGALRAAECHPFGMIGVGKIFENYRDGVTVDDADVALIHAPAEMNYLPLSVPMVNVRATLLQAAADAMITQDESGLLEQSAGKIFFKERTWRTIVHDCRELAEDRRLEIGRSLPATQVDQKRRDAIALVHCMESAILEPAQAGVWTFQRTSIWRDGDETTP